jgi:hypothetical protein
MTLMPRETAVVRLTALIDALPNEGTIGIPTAIAADLVAMLPRGDSLNVRSSVCLFVPARQRKTQILMALSAFAIMTLIVFAISAAIPGGPGIGENPLPPRANLACHRKRIDAVRLSSFGSCHSPIGSHLLVVSAEEATLVSLRPSLD